MIIARFLLWLFRRSAPATVPRRLRGPAIRPFAKAVCPTCGRTVAIHRDQVWTRRHQPCGSVRLTPLLETPAQEPIHVPQPSPDVA